MMHTDLDTTQNNRLAYRIGWGLFVLFLAWYWRVYDVVGKIPDYGDALEVVWGIEWYAEQIATRARPFFFYDGVFHPAGWHVGTLAHSPLIFLIAQPFRWLGGSNFAYNVLALLPLLITFIGARRFFRQYTGAFSAVLAALVYTFITTRTNRVKGHLHIYWATALLPHMAYAIARWRHETGNKWAIRAGIWWGLTLNFSLYMVFLAPLTYLLLGKKLFAWRTFGRVILSGLIALLIGSGALGLFFVASQQASTAPSGFAELAGAGLSINGLFVPSVWHPLAAVQGITTRLFGGTEYANWGLITGILAAIGCVYLVRARTGFGRITFTFVSLVLALGVFVRWDDQFVLTGGLEALNEAIWTIGRAVKPELFLKSSLPRQFEAGIPLPGYLLTAMLPFYDAARIPLRFALVGGLGALSLAAVALDKLPRGLAGLLAVLWLVELLPTPIYGVGLTHDMHPAHAHIITQGGTSRVDVDRYLMHGGEALWGSWVSDVPTSALLGSFMPAFTDVVYDQTVQEVIDPTQFAAVLQQFEVDFVLVHQRWEDVAPRWQPLQTSDAFVDHGCFPPRENTPWPWDVCVYEVAQSVSQQIDVMPLFGWSPLESWGVWTIDQRPRASFVAFEQVAHTVVLEAFPHCVDDELQMLTVRVNGVEIGRHSWQNCDTVRFEWSIPADAIVVGKNELALELEYARPKDGDVRNLAVGFNELRVIRSP